MPKEVKTVTCFLESNGEVLILLRSQLVRNFRGVWGGVSGLIEKGNSPEQQALQEILEETGLPSDEVSVVKKGEPQTIYDADRNLKKIVYPFLFHIADRSKVKIDWEHTDYRWINPVDIVDYQVMPELKETLKLVLA